MISDPPSRQRVVFDCNTFIQAAAFETGPAGACLQLVESGAVELFVSRPTLAELRRVLGYEEVLSISPNLTPERIAGFLQRVTFRAKLIRRVPHILDYPRDPDDEPYIDLAAAASADYLVTRDKDLLSLMAGHSAVCKEFRQKTRPLAVVAPLQFLSIIRRW